MKRIIGLLTTCMFVILANAQENFSEKFVIPLSNPGERGKVELDQVNGDITVTGYTGKEVIITATTVGDGKEQKEETKKGPAGMKRISVNPVEIRAKEQNNTVFIDTESWKRKINIDLQVPTNFDLELNTVHGTINIENVNGTLEVSAVNGKVDLTNISGSVICNSVNGDITAHFKNVETGVPMSFVTLNGNVDVTLPPSTKATAKLRSDRGDIFTDFDMSLEQAKPNINKQEGEYEVSINSWVYGKINGGGPEYTFKNMHGNIIVRKGS